MDRKKELTKDSLFNLSFGTIPPENNEGNTEYKLKIVTEDSHRMEQIAAQMRFRLNEGNGECIYTLGVLDDGNIIGLTDSEFQETFNKFQILGKMNSYTVTLISKDNLSTEKSLYTLLVRENGTNYIETKIACSGGVDNGKSSLIGVLLSGKADDGRGSARLSVFNFKHEIKSGRTSSVSQHILGFDSKGEVMNYSSSQDGFGQKRGWPEIVKKSSKIITLFDLCGHERYLKTTILGLSLQKPDLVFILVGGNMGVTRITKEHLFLCLSLHIPFVIIITKIDICKDRKEVFQDTVQNVKKLIKAPGVGRVPYDVKTEGDVLNAVKNIHSMSVVPIFYVSSVTKEGVPNLMLFMNLFSPKIHLDLEPKDLEIKINTEFIIDQTFRVQGIGLVVGGQLISGTLKVGDKLIFGPANNKYHTVQVKSIHCKRIPLTESSMKCYHCIGIRSENPKIYIKREEYRKGLALLSTDSRPIQVREFTADIMVLKNQTTTIRVNYEPIIHTIGIRQSAKITAIDGPEKTLKTGDRANVTFRFVHRPEYLRAGQRILLTEGLVKIVGKVTMTVEEEIDVV